MSEDVSAPKLLKHRDMRLSWHLPLAQTPGFVRAGAQRLEGSNMSAALVFIGRGQTTPLHHNAAEHFIFMLEGQVEFTVRGEPYLLEPYDLLFFPANAEYRYTNVGRQDAYMLSVLGKADQWPPTSEYEDGTRL
jgi:quercetin dioxygenase-like cupin family protein